VTEPVAGPDPPGPSNGHGEQSADQREPKKNPLFRLLQLLALAAVAGLLALLVSHFFAAHRGPALVKAIGAGKRPVAPAFMLPVIWTDSPTWPQPLQRLLTSRQLSLRQLRGRPVVLNFWASWCVPCKQEAPRLDAAARKHAGKVVFLGIDVQDGTSDARAFLRHHDVRYASLHDNSGLTYDGYGLTGVPETYWLDARGRIVAHVAGAVSTAQLEDGIHAAQVPR
jgi:cytochrome c biogenesis protein CcmG, thiol:disulfide interchange protein DsbE